MSVYLFLLLLPLLLHITKGTVYYVTTNDDQYCFGNDSCHTLDYYINASSKYFTSHTSLYFLPGQHHLKNDLVINSITNFTITGNDSILACTLPANIRVTNVTKFALMNVHLFNCGKSNYYYMYTKLLKLARRSKFIKCNATILLDKCSSVVISNVSINVEVGYAGIFAVKLKNSSTISNLRLCVDCSTCPKFYTHVSGIIIYYYTAVNDTDNNNEKHSAAITLLNYQYKTYRSCPYSFQYAVTLLLFQKDHNVAVNVQSIMLNNLENSSLLYYSGEISENDVMNRLTIKDSLICNNTGNIQLKMFHIVLNNYREIIKDLSFLYYNQQYSFISFENCTFTNNTNMAALIYIVPGNSRVISGYIELKRIFFCSNSQAHFIKVKSPAEILWQLTTSIKLINVDVVSNRHNDGDSLISVTNGVLYLVGPFICANNSYYTNIIDLHYSIAVCKSYIAFTGNNARQIVQAKGGSYIIISELTTVNMSRNNVYMAVKQARTFGDDSRPICPVQFHNYRGNIDKDYLSLISILYKVLMLNNVHMISKNLPGDDISFGNCTWLSGTAFNKRPAESVYKKVMKIANIPINKTMKRLIPLSVCPCINATDYDCYSPNLGSMFPGQTINLKLIVKKKWIIQGSPSTLIVTNTPDDDCSVVHIHQLSQTHFTHGCNNYGYTLWPSYKHINECKLYVGIKEMPEMFYIEVKSCPKGFALDTDKKSCNCDPLLDNNVVSVTSCDLNDQTILRPANSWITADTVNGSYTYLVSSSCPSDYCLPYSSHYNLSDPDSQCQYSRSGVLCGQCKQGLSRVFGSPECKPCTNIYLLLIIPILIIGIIIVTMLFIFHLTVRNGTITSFIFYFNVIQINYTVFFPGCQSILYKMVMFINLDFATETCFFNGMDSYTLTWLRFAFPTYLIIIATLIIVMSHYFPSIQRVTAKKALPVLATLFLLSYTKVLRIVCRVLFWYFTLTHLPSNQVKVVWSIGTDIPLFGLKFMLLFVLCVILFLIFLYFNVILLFTRKLSRFKCITSFKPLLDAYFAPYKDKTFYWTGLLLLIRTFVLGLSAFAKDVSFPAISILLGGLAWWHGITKPFCSKFENIHESVLILNLMTIYAVSLSSGGYKLAQIFISVIIAYFLLVILFYCLIFRYKDIIQSYARKCSDTMKGSLDNKQDSTEMQTFGNMIVDTSQNYQEFQEPLIGYEN